jgi:thiol-disulfide isomerase/thioredoxin
LTVVQTVLSTVSETRASAAHADFDLPNAYSNSGIRLIASLLLFFSCHIALCQEITVKASAASPLSAAPAQNQDFQTELEAGKAAAGKSNYAEATKHFNQANELKQQKCSECYVWLARMDMAAGSLQEALGLTDKAVASAATGAERASANLYRGVVLGRQGNLTAAESAFKAASDANPACVECRFNLGFVLLKESKDAEGVAILKTVASQFAGTPRGSEIQRLIANPSRIRQNYAPEFSARLSTGEEVNLDTLKGKVVLLDFWGTWCEPCRISLPLLKDLAQKVDPAKVAIISIDEYDAKPKWEQFIKTNGMNWGQVYDGDLSLHNAFAVDGFPRYYILGKDGLILAAFKGWSVNGESTIADAINWALKQ